MQIDFTYEQGTGYCDHVLKAKSPSGVDIAVYFDGLDASTIDLNEIEYDCDKDAYKGLAVDFGRGLNVLWVPVATIIQQANAQINDFVSEITKETREWSRHVQSFSQPA